MKTKTDATGTTTYTYDAHGNLRRVVPPTPGATIDYVVDGQNRRVGKRVGGNFTTGWVYDGPRIVSELDASGAVLSRFYYGVNGHAPEAMVRGGVTYRILTDPLGSPRLVVHGTSGAVVQRLDYDAWGKITTDSTPGFQPFGFAGGLYDRTLGLIRFGARDYDPLFGRWTTKDTWRFRSRELNLYAYSANDPLNRLDPTGHKSECERDQRPPHNPPPDPPPPPDPRLDCELRCSQESNAQSSGCESERRPLERELCKDWVALELESCLNSCENGFPGVPIPSPGRWLPGPGPSVATR